MKSARSRFIIEGNNEGSCHEDDEINQSVALAGPSSQPTEVVTKAEMKKMVTQMELMMSMHVDVISTLLNM